ncbi:hypothetical protein TRAPUB_6980 [Trametes pubescens]|uniref:Essential protein Yae1 N-terminal domain-containing protein n=1 Tax=Trametes pubescens TaxID=154538 RepID=A0A1M2V4L1_TRAPU|nr:hypothetical protein TRAPUB_6980 [Trametes pubescens]
MHGEPRATTVVDELPPLPIPPPGGPHLLPPTPPPRDTLSLPGFDSMRGGAYSPGLLSLTPQPGFLTPRSFNTLSPPLVHTPGAHDVELLNELHEASISPTPIHEILRDPAVLSSLLSHRKKPRRASSSSQTPRGRTPSSEDVPPLPDREHDRTLPPRESSRARERERSRDRESTRTTDTASTVKPRKEKRDRERDRDSDSASILTHVLAEEERQARHLKAVLRQTGARLEEELRRADLAESRARTAEITAQDLSARLAASDSARHQTELDTTRAQEECRRWQMQADAAERETRRLQSELARSERARLEKEQDEKEAREAARRVEQTLREWQAREAGREEVRRMELRRRATDHRDEGYENGRAEGYGTGRADGFDEGREEGHREGYETGRSEGFAAGRMTGFEEGRKSGFEEGRDASYSEGYEAGYAQGRKEERARALDAFDRFIETEMDHRRSVSDFGDDRTQRWVEATRKMREREPSPLPTHEVPHRAPPEAMSPPPYPNPAPMAREALAAPQPVRATRDPLPAPKLVWLHRPLNRQQEVGEPLSRSLPSIPEQRA